jgi:signal transduction histidine kinase
MLDSVLRNLLQNAVKFSPAGTCVSVHAERDSAGWRISVNDEGVGMDADELSKLFKVDGHLHRTGTNGEQGVGFGLILSMEFTRLMHGRLEVTSAPGKGSSFRLSLPADDGMRQVLPRA